MKITKMKIAVFLLFIAQTELEGRVYFLFGTTGTGKTTFIQEKLDKIPLPKKIFDLDGEFSKYGAKQINDKDVPNEMAKFKNDVSRLKNHCIVFSEAGMFFAHGESATFDFTMRRILKSARRYGNFVFFDFHSLSEVPTKMLKFCNFLIMKKTSMETYAQIMKYKHYTELIKRYKKVQRSKDPYATEVIIPRDLEIDWGVDDDDDA